MAYDHEAAAKLDAAAVLLHERAKYYARHLWRTERLQRPELPFPMAVDDRSRIYYDPAEVHKRPVNELAAMLEHELGHVLRGHFRRGKGLGDTESWLIATDLEINDDPIPHLPADACTVDRFNLPKGKTAEQYYPEVASQRKRPEPEQGDGSGQGNPQGQPSPTDCGSGAGGGKRPWEAPADGGLNPDTGQDEGPGMGELEQELTRHQVAQAVRDEVAKGRGNVPAHLQRWAEDEKRPDTIPWERELAVILRSAYNAVAGDAESTFSRMGRRENDDFILPGQETPIPSVAAVADTSGSISRAMLAAALNEVDAIIDALGGQPITVLACDATVHEVTKTAGHRQIPLSGGGGTNMGVGIAHAGKLSPAPHVVVVLTDMETPWPTEPPPGVKVIAVALGLDEETAARYAEIYRAPEWLRVIAAPMPQT